MRFYLVINLLWVVHFFSVTARGDDWKHVWLHSSQGVQIQLDWMAQHSESLSGVVANPLWVNVSQPDLSEKDLVRISLENKCFVLHRFSPRGLEDSKQVVELSYAEKGRFTALMKPVMIFVSGSIFGQGCVQAVSVLVNGEEQIDPVSGKAEFTVGFGSQGW